MLSTGWFDKNVKIYILLPTAHQMSTLLPPLPLPLENFLMKNLDTCVDLKNWGSINLPSLTPSRPISFPTFDLPEHLFNVSGKTKRPFCSLSKATVTDTVENEWK